MCELVLEGKGGPFARQDRADSRGKLRRIVDAKFAALKEHVTQIGPENPFLAVGPEIWREFGSQEVYILRESRVESALPETDLFAGIA